MIAGIHGKFCAWVDGQLCTWFIRSLVEQTSREPALEQTPTPSLIEEA